MKPSLVTDNIYRLAANIYEEQLFEGMWPIPHGVSMNAYVIKGDKTALIDGVGTWPGVGDDFLAQLKALDLAPEKIDYLIMNHLEPDHTGWLAQFRNTAPPFRIITSERGAALLSAFFEITQNIAIVKSGDSLDLGKDMNLQFEEIPNVHWPETIATYETNTGTLFPCDAFGSFGAVTEHPYDDQLGEQEIQFYEQEALRYYANIVGPFSNPVLKAIEKLAPLKIRHICPSHGIVWRRNPAKIIDDYVRYASYAKGPAKPEIAVLWSSMYGNTEKGLQSVLKGIEAEGVPVQLCQIPQTHVSYALKSVWECSGVVLGMPTYEYKMFPPMASALEEILRKKAINRAAFRFGSYGWSGGAEKELKEILERNRSRWDFLPGVEFNGAPKSKEQQELFDKGRELARKVKALCAEAD